MSSRPEPYRRIHERGKIPMYRTCLKIRFRVGQEEEWKEGEVTEIGRDSLRLVAAGDPNSGLTPPVFLRLPMFHPGGEEHSLFVAGKVVWMKRDSGGACEYGIVYDEMEEDDRYLYIDFLADLLTEGKARSLSAY